MDISKLNSLVELDFKKTEEVEGKRPFLKWLKPDKRTYNWEDVTERIFKLTAKIKSLIKVFIFVESLNILSLISPQVYVGLFGFSHFKKGLLGSTSSHFLK